MKKALLAGMALLVFSLPLFSDSRMIPASFREVSQKVRPAVVNISTVQVLKRDYYSDPFFSDDFYEQFFGIPKSSMKRQSLGTGFIVSPDGYIMTNNHVVDKADEITVKLYNQKEYKAKVVGSDKETDLAVIKINAKNLQQILMGDSDSIEVGDWVVAVGSPFGLEQTVTQGIISAKGRIIGAGPYDDFLQTDAAINPGNSGGPLINLDGEVIGINTAITSNSGGYEGIGFAIPVNMAKRIYGDIINKGKVVRGWLGVIIQELTPELKKHFKVSGGVLISQVYSGSPAHDAGIRQGDVVTEIDGKKIEKYRELQSIVAAAPVGRTIEAKIVRDGREQTVKIKVAERNLDNLQAQKANQFAPGVGKAAGCGIITSDLTPDLASRLGITANSGAVVIQVEQGSAADNAGVMAGDVIHECNGRRINTKADMDKVIEGIKKGGQVVLLIERGNTMVYLAFTNN
ncbi:MAG: DegQ family serine endoprotease [Spirochaetia bacterium]|nr:DegQ family serine endoprotease [Spirochaetia bacterium]